MPTIKLELDTESFNKLMEIAVEERRPIRWQVEVLVLKALGRWPLPASEDAAVTSLPSARELRHE
jgi:hypothetical protein